MVLLFFNLTTLLFEKNLPICRWNERVTWFVNATAKKGSSKLIFVEFTLTIKTDVQDVLFLKNVFIRFARKFAINMFS
jgi:hypothetical protein